MEAEFSNLVSYYAVVRDYLRMFLNLKVSSGSIVSLRLINN